MITSENAFALINKLQLHQSESVSSLLHELRNYQMELIIQNEELRGAQEELESSRKKFSDLYDGAPIGYLVIDGDGVILETNSTGASMLAIEKRNLVNRKFSNFIPPEYQDAFYFHRKKVFQTGKRQLCTLKLLKKTGSFFYAQLASIIATETNGTDRRFRMAIVDISEGRRMVALERSLKRQNFLSACLMTAQEEERKRIAFELHDDLGQSLVLLILRLRNAQAQAAATHPELKSECEQMGRLATGMLDTVRRISDGLTPCTLDEFSLTDSLRLLINNFIQSAGLSISLEIENMDGLFSTMAQVAIYRIFQEALTNAVKHAVTARISIKALKAKGAALFQIQDNGVGFDMKEAKSTLVNGRSGMGLTSMEDRVVMLKGRFKITSRLSGGTKISFRIPYEPAMKRITPYDKNL